MDYFSERSNPFYDRTCNNEIVKMQRLNPDQLNNLTGLEYILLHVQEPILYVIRKQHRHSPQQATPLADYYIIGGVVYQAPDLCSVINSRLLNTVAHLHSAFDEVQSYSQYHPSKSYWWDFKEKDKTEKDKGKKTKKEEPSSLFQRQRVDVLLEALARKYPPRFPGHQEANKEESAAKSEIKTEIKTEKQDDVNSQVSSQSSIKMPPEKKIKISR
ncbi:mediator of RNA polymerase II transcription subunit 6-like [Tubulanus polymorphus]|uniref:mediator of RNA polymerase II transcription subunit 6-like n=1 Tax=Tubulanus polymorphus TaxID=672921 RepID=UPI003DA58578